MKKVFIILIIILLPSLVFAADYKTLNLGDSTEATTQKLLTLIKDKEITFQDHSFFTKVLNHDVEIYPSLFNEKLYSLEFYFPKFDITHVNSDIRFMIENEIKPMFRNIYGKPTQEYRYPSIIDISSGYINSCCKWVLKNKTILVGITEDDNQGEGDPIYGAEIMIYDNMLAKAKAASKLQKEMEAGKDF
ncbi:MAG TPA: hypothetical protein DDW50_17450 [Firmicutes bacterium]|jgi:hypothetical protein|nr:hypothetical protein [Bacillota bacterium]